MGHYASEMGRPSKDNPSKYLTDDEREALEKFYGQEWVEANSSCPRCGAALQWDYLLRPKVDNLMLHIAWHKKLAALIKSANSPFGSFMLGDPEI
jgi:hypothetical protein